MERFFVFVALLASPHLWCQWIDRQPSYETSIISTVGEDGVGIFCADAFSMDVHFLPKELTFYGRRSNSEPMKDLVEGFNILFFNNRDRYPDGHPYHPESALLALTDIPLEFVEITEDGKDVSFYIDFDRVSGGDFWLQEGELYWISGFPTVKGNAWEEGRWNWYSSGYYAEEGPVVIDPDDVFGEGITDWTRLEGFISNAPKAFAWKMMGDHGDPIKVPNFNKESIKIYPLPFDDELRVSGASSELMIKELVLTDIQGRKCMEFKQDEVVDTSKLSSGVYILQYKIEDSSFYRKVLKR